MELTRNKIKQTKGIAILFMIVLHLFCTKEYQGLYEPILFIGQVPLVYYLALFGDCCVVIYCFCSGYGLFFNFQKNKKDYVKSNLKRIFKLYINYWIVFFIFVIIIGAIVGSGNQYIGNFKSIILTITGISPAYNGAWWFFTTYVILVLISPMINKIVLKHNIYLVILISFIFYIVAYIQRIKGIILIDNEIGAWIIRNLALVGTSQFPFIVGTIFAKEKIYSKINRYISKLRFKNSICIISIILMIIAHGIIETLFVAIFTGIAFICIFNIIDKPKILDKTLNYLGKHSTNLWLTHMFFYMIYFKDIVFILKYSFLIFPWLMILCLISSHCIMIINNIILNIINGIKNNKLEVKI